MSAQQTIVLLDLCSSSQFAAGAAQSKARDAQQCPDDMSTQGTGQLTRAL